MQIQINGETHEMREDLTIAELISELDFSNRRIAVEINLNIIPRSQHQQHHLQAGDKVEIVQAIGGG